MMFSIGNITHNPVEIHNAALLRLTIHANGINPTICRKAINPSIRPPKTINATIIVQKDNDITQLNGKRIAMYMIPVYNGVYTRATNTCPKYLTAFISSPLKP